MASGRPRPLSNGRRFEALRPASEPSAECDTRLKLTGDLPLSSLEHTGYLARLIVEDPNGLQAKARAVDLPPSWLMGAALMHEQRKLNARHSH